MTDSQIRQKIAEKCGWKPPKQGSVLWTKNEGVEWADKNHLPNYPNDINAMQSAIMSQSKKFRNQFETLMDNHLAGVGKLWCEATAQDYATIFLQAKGLNL